MVLGDVPTAWMFQANPKRYDLLVAIAEASDDHWAMNQHRDHVSDGDRVWFFVSGAKASIYAVGRTASTAYRAEEGNEFGDWKVDITYEAVVEPPLLRDPEIDADPVLASFGPFLGRMGTNFPIPSSVVAHLESLLVGRLHPVAAKHAPSPSAQTSRDVSVAVETARRWPTSKSCSSTCASSGPIGSSRSSRSCSTPSATRTSS